MKTDMQQLNGSLDQNRNSSSMQSMLTHIMLRVEGYTM